MRNRLRRRHVKVLGWVVVLAIFAAALIAWVGGNAGGSGSGGLPTNVAGAPTGTAPGSTSGSGLPTSGQSGSPGTGAPSLPAFSLPSTSIDANSSGAPAHAITMRVTSNELIAGFGYLVKAGKPSRYGAYYVKSPVTVHTTGHSYGAVAEVIAQSGYNATYVSCTLTIDGVVRAHNTAHGAFKFAICTA